MVTEGMVPCIGFATVGGVGSIRPLGNRVPQRSLRKGLSRVTGNCHARFLGEGGGREAAPLTRRARAYHPDPHPRR